MRTLIAMATVTGIVALATAGGGDIPRKEDVPKNLNLLKTTSSAKIRATAAIELGRRGAIRASDVAEAVEPLLDFLKKDKDADVRKACAQALGDINLESEKCVAALTDALNDKSTTVKIAAAQALAQYGSEAKSALPNLRELAKAKDDKKLSQAAAAAAKQISGTSGKKGG